MMTNDVTNTLSTKASNQCDVVKNYNNINIKKLQFKPDKVCGKTSYAEFGQVSAIESSCLIKNLQQSLVDTIVKMSSSAQAGLGLSVSKVSSNIKSQLESIVSNKCSELNNTNILTIDETTITSCVLKVVQNATARTSCAIDSLQSLSAKVQAELTSEAKGWGILDFGWIAGIVIIVIIIGVVMGFGRNKSKQTGGDDSCNIFSSDTFNTSTSSTSSYANLLTNPYIIMLIMFLILLVVVLISRYYHSDVMTQLEEIKLLNKQIAHAKHIINARHDYIKQQHKHHHQQQSQSQLQLQSQPCPNQSRPSPPKRLAYNNGDDDLLSMDYHDDLNNYYVY